MKKTIYRFLCMVLTLCMLCTMTAFTAMAENAVDATIAYGTAYKLPTTVGNVTDIAWTGNVDATKFGTQTITGTGTGGEATYTVRVAAPKVVYKNNFDSYPTGAGSTSYYESPDKFLKLYADGGADGNTIVEDAAGGKYFKAGPSTSMSMDSALRPQGTINGKVAMRFRFRGVDLKGEWKDILRIILRDANSLPIGEIRFHGGSDGNSGNNVDKTKYLYARYSVDGSTWNTGGQIASNFNNGDTGWVNLTLVVDQTSGTYSLYAENIVLFENVRFNGTSADSFTANSKIASQLCFTRRGMTSGDGYMCIDDFMYLDLNDASLSYPESNADVTQPVANATVGETYALPAAVGGINVKWNQASVDTSKIGRQVVTGKNDFGQDVTLKVNVGTNLVYSDTAESYATTKTTGFHIVTADINSGAVKVADDAGNSVISFDTTSATSAYETGAYYNKGNGGIANKVTFSCRVKFTQLLEHESSSNYYTPMTMRFYDDAGKILNDINFVWYGLHNNMYVRSSNSSYTLNWNKGGNSGIGRSSNDTDWADIKAVIDIENDSFKAYVNGSLIFEDEILNSSATNLAYVGFACRSTGSKLLTDDFKWYDDANMKVPTGAMPTDAISTKVGLGASAEKAEVTLTMSDGSTMKFPVTYTVDSSTPGYKSAVGTVEGFNAETVLINAKVLSYEPVDFVFEKDGSTSAEPANGGTLKSIKVKRYAASNDDAVMMVAVYDNDVLKSVTPADITNAVLGEEKSIDLNIALPADVTNLDIRTFILDGKATLKPIDLDSYWESSKKKPVIYLAGDSTTEDVYAQSGGDYYYPRTGWGEKLSNYIDTDKYVIDNRGKSGRSTKSYIDEGRLDDILEDISVGDYLFINFGHNDQATNDPSRGTTVDEYKENLRTYIDSVRSKGANPVLVTSVPRLVYKMNGTEVWGHQYTGTTPAVDYYGYENLKDRTDAMKAVAEEKRVPYLDLNILMADHIRDLSIEDAKDIYMILSHDDSRFIGDSRFAVSKFNKNGINYDATYASNNDHDTTHLNYYGADLCASFVAQEIEAKIPSLAAALTNYTVTKPAGW